MKRKPSTTCFHRPLATAALGLLLASAPWAAPKFQVLHAFGASGDGGGLWTSVTLDRKGNLYGATSGGGTYNGGTVFRLTPHPNGNWTETILHSFPSSQDDGGDPNGGMVQDSQGKWYGTTRLGGAYHYGAVFDLTHGAGGWEESVVYSFGADFGDGGEPTAGLAMDAAGNLYGTAQNGGYYNGGTVYELAPSSDGWNETVLHEFNGNQGDGAGPFAGLVLDASGNIYGTTRGGGAHGQGTVYELQPTSSGWQEAILHSFNADGKDGVVPGWGALALDEAGSIYGTTGGGGTHTCLPRGNEGRVGWPQAGRTPAIGDCGTIFKVSKNAQGVWKERILYSFRKGATGSGPGAGMVRDKAGNLYGTTIYGGSPSCACGVVYRLAPGKHGSRWKYTVLHTFYGYDGAEPDANLILDAKGNLYGTTATGGIHGAGVVFKVAP
jgi:uncharacterized repeat protein (TIGR03803 family)